MTITPRNLVTSATRTAWPRVLPTLVKEKTFSSATLAATLPVMTAMAYNTSTNLWVEWATGGANGTGVIRGFVFPNAVDILATGAGEVIGAIMLGGEVHYADIVAPGGTLAQLKTALQTQVPSMRELGIIVEGLDKIN